MLTQGHVSVKCDMAGIPFELVVSDSWDLSFGDKNRRVESERILQLAPIPEMRVREREPARTVVGLASFEELPNTALLHLVSLSPSYTSPTLSLSLERV